MALTKATKVDSSFVTQAKTLASKIMGRLSTLQDIGVARPYLGWSPTNDAQIQASHEAIGDTEIMLRGGLHVSKKARGIRRNNVCASFNLNRNGFAPEVTGVSDSAGLAGYGSADSVAIYAQADTRALEDWERVSSATYTSTSFVPNDLSILPKIMVGDIVRTLHPSPCWGLVQRVDADKVVVSSWANTSTSNVTPANGTGLLINPENKLWLFNGNIALTAEGEATNAAMFELGFINHKLASPGQFNGLDLVVLPTSTYGATSAVWARSTGANQRWANAVQATGCHWISFHAEDGGIGGPSVGSFVDAASGAVSFLSRGRSTNAFRVNVAGSNTPAFNTNSNGYDIVSGVVLGNAPNGAALPLTAKKFFVNNTSAFNLVLPSTNLVAGMTIKFGFNGGAEVTVSSNSPSQNVNGATSYVFTPAHRFLQGEATWDGSSWSFYH